MVMMGREEGIIGLLGTGRSEGRWCLKPGKRSQVLVMAVTSDGSGGSY